MSSRVQTDYLVIGAGAMGMAFTDVLLTETDATVTLVDRRARPGGHWNDAYPFVRLHQPSHFYGVNSRPLGNDTLDQVGWNEGLYELASGPEVVAYFDQVMQQQFLPSGRVRYLPLHEVHGDGGVRSALSGEVTEVEVFKRTVDAGYMNVVVPAMRQPPYTVEGGVSCAPLNALAKIQAPADGYVVVGAGKTGMDACLFLLAHEVDPSRITWIMPRDSWILDRAQIQPGPEFFSLDGFNADLEAASQATDLDDLFRRLEEKGRLLRLDPAVRPTMYRCATVTQAELEQLRRIENVVRLGRVTAISDREITLEQGTVPTTPGTLHVDCSADGLATRPEVSVFDGEHMTLQTVRTCQQVFSAAFIAHVEAAYADDALKNELCHVIPHPDTDLDWVRTTLGNSLNGARWAQDKELSAWLAGARLDFTSSMTRGADPERLQAAGAATAKFSEAAVANMARLLEEAGAPA